LRLASPAPAATAALHAHLFRYSAKDGASHWADKALRNRKELRDERALSVENVVEDQGLA
jgi:hypothetical protein